MRFFVFSFLLLWLQYTVVKWHSKLANFGHNSFSVMHPYLRVPFETSVMLMLFQFRRIKALFLHWNCEPIAHPYSFSKHQVTMATNKKIQKFYLKMGSFHRTRWSTNLELHPVAHISSDSSNIPLSPFWGMGCTFVIHFSRNLGCMFCMLKAHVNIYIWNGALAQEVQYTIEVLTPEI